MDDLDLCPDCGHPADDHNADGCTDERCGCGETWISIELRAGDRR